MNAYSCSIMLKKRLINKQIGKFLEHKNAIIITGMRQVGKTSLMKQIYETTSQPKYWFDFENPLDLKIFEELDYNNIYKHLYTLAKSKEGKNLYIFINEIQNFPEITKIVKYLIDHHQVKFFLTGSSNFYLKNLFPESLSGRKFIFQLEPLNFQEYLYWHGKINYKDLGDFRIKKALANQSLIKAQEYKLDYQEYLDYGGFPEVVLTKDREIKLEILKNIFASFFEKDLKILSDYKDIQELRDLIILLAPRVGSLLDVSKIASELSLSRKKIYSRMKNI